MRRDRVIVGGFFIEKVSAHQRGGGNMEAITSDPSNNVNIQEIYLVEAVVSSRERIAISDPIIQFRRVVCGCARNIGGLIK